VQKYTNILRIGNNHVNLYVYLIIRDLCVLFLKLVHICPNKLVANIAIFNDTFK